MMIFVSFFSEFPLLVLGHDQKAEGAAVIEWTEIMLTNRLF